MMTPDLEQFDLLANVDDLTARTRDWCEIPTLWEPTGRIRALLRRVLDRVETLRLRLEAPLVVATFGGTGTGKGTLVNALVGEEVTRSGRQRPTTTQPVLIVHRDADADVLGLPLDAFELVRSSSDLLRDMVMIDCPDPDTSETADAGENLALLRSIVPYCDVLIFAATQEKYRSGRVLDELADSAAGCRLLFVQTHANTDSDIRDDWRTVLRQYEVPEMFFVDSKSALDRRKAGLRPDGEFARLLEVMRDELAASERVRVRRANLLDLLQAATDRGCEALSLHRPKVQNLLSKLAEERNAVAADLADALRRELLDSRHLWERRLLASVTTSWGFTPFSAVLRLYNGMGGFIASMSLSRARTAAQVAIIGAAEAGRRFRDWQAERTSEERTQKLDMLALDDSRLRQAQISIAGFADEAGLTAALPADTDLDRIRGAASDLEARFLGSAGQRIETIIHDVAARNSRWYVRWFYESLLGVYLLFLVYRIAKNFFYDSFLATTIDPDRVPASLLPMEFYIAGGAFLLLWSGLLVIAFTRRVRRGIDTQIQSLARELAGRKLTGGLFPQLEQSARDAERLCEQLQRIAADVKTARVRSHAGGRLGHRHPSASTER